EERRRSGLRVAAPEHQPQRGERGGLSHLRELEERRRADVRTAREAEKHERRRPHETRPREGAPGGVGEREVAHRLRLRQPRAACQARACPVKLLREPIPADAGGERGDGEKQADTDRSEEHTSELSHRTISYA